MRNRPWVLVVAIVGFLLIFGSYTGWRLTRANERIRTLILSQVRPYLDPQSDIRKLDLTLGDLRLKDVVIIPKNRRFTLRIEDVRVRYQLWNMVKYGFSPRKIAHEALFIRPVLYIHQPLDTMTVADSSQNAVQSDEILETLRLIKRITLQQGSFYYENILGDTIRVAHDLNGLLLGASPDSAQMRFDGKLFSSDQNNLKFNGQLNLTVPRIEQATIEVLESEPTSEQPLLLPRFVSITSGKIQGRVDYTAHQGALGFIQVSEGGFSIRGVDISCEGMDLKGDILNSNISIQSNIQSFNGSPLHVSGHITDFFNPHLDVDVRCPQFNVSSFFEQAIPGISLDIQGHTEFGVNISGSPYNPQMTGSLNSRELNLYGFQFGALDTRVVLRDSIFSIQGSGGRQGELSLALTSTLDLRQHQQMIELISQVTGNFNASLPLWVSSRITKSTGAMDLSLSGELGNLSGQIDSYFNLATIEGDSIFVQPLLRYEDRVLSVEVNSNTDLEISGQVNSPFYADHQWQLEANGLSQLFQPVFSGKLRGYFDDLDLSGTYESNRQAWQLQLDGTHQYASNPVSFSVDLNSEKAEQGASPVYLSAEYRHGETGLLPVQGQWRVLESGVDIQRFLIGEIAEMAGYVPFSENDSFHVDLRIPDGSLYKMHSVFPGLASFDANVTGHLSLRGPRHQPDIRLNTVFQDGFFHGVGPFRSDLNFIWASDSLHRMQWNIWESDSRIVQCDIHEIAGDSLAGSLAGENINIHDLLTAISGVNVDLEAIGDLDMQILGPKASPVVLQELTISEGKWGGIPFENFSFTAVDTLWKNGSIASGKQYIQMARMEHANGFILAGWGTLPHDLNETMDLSLLGQGNLPGLIEDQGTVVQSAKGDTEFFLRFGGSRGEWTIGEGRFDIQNGELKLESVVKEITHIQGTGTYHPENQFIQFNDFQCMIDGGLVHISNVMPGPDENIVPLAIGPLNMYLGVLQLQSEQKGVQVHIPGIMEKGDKGKLWFTGMGDVPDFTVSGPVEAPHFTGTINLSDAQITYPFLQTSDIQADDPVMLFLGNVDWDVQIVPDRDVHYVREIGSAMGNIYINLWLRDDFGNISVSGQSADASIEVWGELLSTEGNLEILDHYFRVERINFQYPRGSNAPVLTGRASTSLVDSAGMSSTVWANLIASDVSDNEDNTNEDLSHINIQFTTDNPALGITEADLLAALGYSVEGMRDRAYDALGMQMENILVRPILKPIEKGIRRHLGLDLVRFSSMFSRNIVQLRTEPMPVFDPKLLLRSARLMLGKYVAPGLFVTYSGQVGSQVWYYYHTQSLGLRHAVTLEYTIVPDLFLEFEYMYDSQLLDDRREDKRIMIRHTFPF